MNIPNANTDKTQIIPIYLVILYSILTLSIYIPFWFIRRSAQMQRISNQDRLNPSTFKIAIYFSFLYWVLVAISFFLFNSVNQTGQFLQVSWAVSLDTISQLLNILITCLIIIQSFKFRSWMLDAFRLHNAPTKKISRLWTLLFQIVYLQFHLNSLARFLDEQPEPEEKSVAGL